MNELDALRKNIDEIDAQLLPLFLKRMDCCKAVAEYKAANNLPVLDKARESIILSNKVEKVCDRLKMPVSEFFSAIMKISRKLQSKILADGSATSPWLENFDMCCVAENPVVAYQGVPGANSETALLKFFGENCKKVNTMTFDEVFDAVEEGRAQYGILPIENTTTGSILASYDLLEKRNFYIVGEVAVHIEHCLIGLNGAELRDIKKVYSHEQGYMQCKAFIDSYPKMEFQPYYNTAVAAKMIAGLGDVSNAAIADKRTAELYNLKVLAENISSAGNNTTRFVIVSKRGHINESCNKISVLFTLPNESGALSSILSAFADNGLNLVKLESRPSHDGNFEYMFFVDFEGNLMENTVKGIMTQMQSGTLFLKVLGNYKSL